MVVFETGDVYTAPPQLAGAMFDSAVLFGVFGVGRHLQERATLP